MKRLVAGLTLDKVARNEIWSMDVVADQLADGRRVRALTILDLFTRECFAIDVAKASRARCRRDTRASALRARPAPTDLLRQRNRVRQCGDGSLSVHDGVPLDFSRRGKPTDNAAIESFNGSVDYRHTCHLRTIRSALNN